MNDHLAFVGIGSSLDPERNIVLALDLLACQVQVRALSTFYRNAALERPDDPPFINGVIRLITQTEPVGLKYRVLRVIEQALGRVRSVDRYAPRPIDLDLLLYDDAIIHEAGLDVPDSEIRRRVFVAAPLLELAPNLILPDGGPPLAEADCLKDAARLIPLPAFTNALKGRLKL